MMFLGELCLKGTVIVLNENTTVLQLEHHGPTYKILLLLFCNTL